LLHGEMKIMAKRNNRKKGTEGEKIAAKYLEEKGYEVLWRNYRYKNKEIDLICKKDEYLVVVEVKTRYFKGDEWPDEIVTMNKQRYLIEATEEFMMKHHIDLEVRFDVIFVYMRWGEFDRLEHIEDAFHPLA